MMKFMACRIVRSEEVFSLQDRFSFCFVWLHCWVMVFGSGSFPTMFASPTISLVWNYRV
ncbi:unnamed protein product [Arabidopsis halleri]